MGSMCTDWAKRQAIQVMMCAAISVLAATISLPGATIVVAPGGKDAHPGTREQPLATLHAAQEATRKAEAGSHRIVVMPGDYFLDRPFTLDSRDNGLTIEAAQRGKATFYGGVPVTNWRRDGERFWCADVPGVQEGKWDFRALVVGDQMPERARWPESGTFVHQSVFPVSWLTSVGGGWERKPTPEELTTMVYDPKDIPASLDVKNAEVRVYHMWDESLVGVKQNDSERHTLVFATPAGSPPGAFGVKKYVIFNTREGMTRPGQWYLDRTGGRIVYWPLTGQDMSKTRVVAPRLERLIHVAGSKNKPVENITLRGLVLQATTTPLKPSGFGAGQLPPALGLNEARRCTLEALEICNVGGQGIDCRGNDCRILDCQVHHTGACGIRVDGSSMLLARNHIHHLGVYHPSAVAVSAAHRSRDEREKGVHLYRNEIHDAPYSGIVGSGSNNLFEENLIYRVMRELQDGAAIYGGMTRAILRGNMVRDVVKMGEGYGISAYYLDEGARDCIVERNVSVGVERPTHNHIARNTIIRDNVFIVDGDMSLTFARSAGCTFEGNTLFVPGKIKILQPSAIRVWKGNVIFREGQDKQGVPQAFTIDDAMPSAPSPQRRTWALPVVRVERTPRLDGDIDPNEWPGPTQRLDRIPSRDPAPGAPVFVKFCYDDRFLYVVLTMVMFEPEKMHRGTVWGQDDGAEICLAGKTPEGQPAVFVVRGYAGGKCESVTVAGAPAAAAEKLGRGLQFTARDWKKWGGGWRGRWAFPFDALGLKPVRGLKVAFNMAAFRSEDAVWTCWEGTLGENWRLDQAGMLQLK
jgi:hypothetical protein